MSLSMCVWERPGQIWSNKDIFVQVVSGREKRYASSTYSDDVFFSLYVIWIFSPQKLNQKNETRGGNPYSTGFQVGKF